MKRPPEEELDLLIDTLNQEKQFRQKLDPDTAEMLTVVRAVKSLRRQAAPNPNLGWRIRRTVLGRTRRRAWAPFAALAAGLLLFAVLANWTGLFRDDVVYAMEKAVARLTSYHGIMEVRAENAAGEEWLVRRVELWSDGDRYAVRQDDGTLTVNNGNRKWQVRPADQVVALLPLVPDSPLAGFDLRDEAKRAKQYPHKVIGQETIAGRQTNRLEISPPGGAPYYLWIDAETNLPLQLQTAWQNALRTTYTFTSFTPNREIDAGLFAFQPPEGYEVVEKDPGQLVATIEEAAAISGFAPLLPAEAPARIFVFPERIVLDYDGTTISQTPARGVFQPETHGALGEAGGGPLEIIADSLRWRQKGLEIGIQGPKRLDLARQIAADLKLPDTGQGVTARAQVMVPVDMDIVKANQQQVDGGHSPWQLDPRQVAMTFVSQQTAPEGSSGDSAVPFESLTLAVNTGVEAVVDVSGGPVARVYLQRLVRQDDSGIWTVVGYDPR